MVKAKANRVARHTVHVGGGMATVYHPTLPDPLLMSEDEAGRRIAVHTSLLEACQAVVAAQECGDVGDVITAMDFCRLAVEKATANK